MPSRPLMRAYRTSTEPAVLAISLTMALYAPIRALYSKVTHQEKASSRENELLSISNSFESTAKEAAVLEDRVMNLSSIARNQFLVRLLNGCYTDAEEGRCTRRRPDCNSRGPLMLSLHFRQSKTRSARARLVCFRRTRRQRWRTQPSPKPLLHRALAEHGPIACVRGV